MSASNPVPVRRLFIGLMAGERVREAVVEWRSRWQWPRGAALSAPAHLHLTLHFLGDVPESNLPALLHALGTVPFEPLMLRLGRWELWPRGMAVVRPEANAHLDRLHADIVGTLQSLGMDVQSTARWKPHLTLARKAAQAQPPDEPLQVDWHVQAFSLVWSRLPPQVPRTRYESLGAWGSVSSEVD